ncbi:phosphopantetheine-binding protein, partial [Rheinheimera gaetbuli]
QALTSHLKQSLPEYMVPGVFVVLERLPLTPNGKVDRKALPEPDLAHLQAEYTAPATETEQALVEIWQKLLDIERVGVHDNFFELGGHSLLVTRLITSINRHFDLSLSIKEPFSKQTVQALAELVDEHVTLKKLSSGELDIDALSDDELNRYLEMVSEE